MSTQNLLTGACTSSAPTPPEAGEGDRTPLADAANAAEELYRLRDTFFPRDPAEKAAALRARADAALALLDALPSEQKKSPQLRGVYEFLRGKILDVFPDYHKEAEDHLSKAVKLNPSLVDAWLCLGNCIWKKGDLSAAKNCFSLALGKGSDKKILCQISMLERSMAQGSTVQALLVEESIKHAKEAIMLDIGDGNSWYNMGNAYLTSFFVGGAWDHTKLHHSVKAYQNAEKDKTMNLNPDLYYNCATNAWAPAPSPPLGFNPWAAPGWNQADLARSFNTMTLQQQLQQDWYFDSGATSHMTSDAGSSVSERDGQVQ